MKSERPFTFEEEEDIIEREFVLTLTNDGDVFSRTGALRDSKDFVGYRNTMNRFIVSLAAHECYTSSRATAASFGYKFIPKLLTRVVLAMWDHYDLPHDKGYEIAASEIASYATKYDFPMEPAKAQSIPVSPTPVATKEITMSNATTPFETINYVYGAAVKDMTEEQLIAGIKRAEKEIADLGAVKASSKKLDAKRTDLQASIDKMVEALDAK